MLGYHPTRAFNVQAVWGPMLWADPYSSYTDTRRLTRAHKSVVDQRFGNADTPDATNVGARLRDARQNMIFSGRPANKVFYSAGISSDGGDDQGVNSSIYHARVAVDVMKNLTIGALLVNGTCSGQADCIIVRDFTRQAIDLQADFGAARVNAVYLQAKDDNQTATAEEKNNAYYLQAQYVMKNGKKPTFVPLVRLESYEKNDGADEYTEATFNLSYYVTDNARVFVEFWKQLDVPAGVDENDRLTVQFAVAW